MAGKQKFKEDSIGALSKFSSITVKLAPSLVTIGGLQYETSELQLSTNLTGAGGLDTGVVQDNKVYNTFMILDSGNPAIIASLSDSPSGFSTYTKVGSFNTITAGAINGASEKDEGEVGDTKYSMLTEEAFIAENGGGWILADGRDITDSRFATLTGLTTVPDARGQFLRGKNNGRSDGQQDPDGERGLGAQQSDAFQGHHHQMWMDNDSSGLAGGGPRPVRTEAERVSVNTGQNFVRDPKPDYLGNGNPRTSNETRPKNITMNLFIKIN